MADITAQLHDMVTELRQLLAVSTTEQIAGMVHVTRMRFIGQPQRNNSSEPRLHSPARQQAFLLGLLLATEEPIKPVPLNKAKWERCIHLLNEAFEAYAELFMPDQPGHQSDEWWRTREVAGPAFLHYFSTGLIASVEQICDRIRAYCVPFDAELVQAIGLSASDALAIMTFIIDDMQQSLDVLAQLGPKQDEEKLRFFRTGDFRRRHDPEFPEFYRTHYPILYNYQLTFLRQGLVARAKVEAAFPAQAAAFWERYAIKRGQGPALQYPTEESVFDTKPILILNEADINCPSTNTLFEAVLMSCEKALSGSSVRRQFFKHRDKVLEQEGEKLFRRLAGPEAQLVSSVFETPKAHYEHDLLVIMGCTVLVVEAKASPPVEPSRLPERAFERLRQSFRKDTGIQKGFEQAARLQRRLAAGESVPLYSRTGELVVVLDPQQHTECFCVCLTRDDFGHLATNLSLLLEKEPTEPFPWAVNILDLEAMADAWDFMGWDFHRLLEYLRQRQQVQGHMVGGDELEFAGAFIRHGNLTFSLDAHVDLMPLDPHYSDFFDELYVHLRYGGPAPSRQFSKPVLTDVRESLRKGQPVFGKAKNLAGPVTPPRRNDPCPCNSGLKWKKCHGQ
ncbi:SEC-C domain-containing protein [Hymenobacter sp. UYP22]|uniref:SEC-C domain-containing protein n=1 Tax=Hymenobacter sp. UYP22 TaxID=3156348 RepID=UPI0033986D54